MTEKEIDITNYIKKHLKDIEIEERKTDKLYKKLNIKVRLTAKKIGKKYGFKSVCYGHAGDGNLHVNIIKGDLSEQQWEEELPKAIKEIFELTVSLGGTISGEHGIGWVQKNYMPIAFSKVQLDIMRQIKTVFDPKNILNPSKIFPES